MQGNTGEAVLRRLPFKPVTDLTVRNRTGGGEPDPDAAKSDRPSLGPRVMRVAGMALGLLAVGGLSGCGMFGIGGGPEMPCPRFGVLKDAAEVTRFARGGGRDLTDVEFRARIQDIVGECSYDEGQVDLEYALTFYVERGPAAVENKGSFVYFVAYLAPDKRVLYREERVREYVFVEGAPIVAIREPIEITLDLDGGTNGPQHIVTAGIVLSESELQYNRDRRVR